MQNFSHLKIFEKSWPPRPPGYVNGWVFL